MKSDKIISAGLFLFALVIRLIYWGIKGRGSAADTSDYTSVCQVATETPSALVTGEIGIEYLGFSLPFCTVYNLTGSFTVWIGIQVILSALGVVFLYHAGKMVHDRITGIVAAGFLAVLWDTFQWTTIILSDSFFVFVCCVTIFALANHSKVQSQRSRLVALVVLAYLAITRPFGIPMVVGILFTDQFTSELKLLPRHRGVIVTAVVLAIGGIAARLQWVLENVIQSFSSGTLVMNDPTFVYPYISDGAISVGYLLQNIHHLLIIGILRMCVFFLPVLDRFSLLHNIVNLATLVPMMSIAGIGSYQIVRRREYKYIQMWLIPVVMILLVVAVTFVDWDWRYRAPAGPFFAMLAGYTVSINYEVIPFSNRLSQYSIIDESR